MSVRMRVTRSHTGNRRSHHALKEPRLSKCANCSAEHLRHRMCPECGHYRGKQVVDVVAQREKRMQRREERLKESGAAATEDEAEAEAQEEEDAKK